MGDQGKVTEIYVKADSSQQRHPDRVRDRLKDSRGEGRDDLEPGDRRFALSGTLTTFFTVIGLVALLAGGFGVVNTMMISVSERTREIGTLKAIGARQGQIMKIFISEAFLIGVIGACRGDPDRAPGLLRPSLVHRGGERQRTRRRRGRRPLPRGPDPVDQPGTGPPEPRPGHQRRCPRWALSRMARIEDGSGGGTPPCLGPSSCRSREWPGSTGTGRSRSPP